MKYLKSYEEYNEDSEDIIENFIYIKGSTENLNNDFRKNRNKFTHEIISLQEEYGKNYISYVIVIIDKLFIIEKCVKLILEIYSDNRKDSKFFKNIEIKIRNYFKVIEKLKELLLIKIEKNLGYFFTI